MVNLGGGCFLVLTRINDGTTFRQFVFDPSIDSNWHDIGSTNFTTGSANNEAPPWLSFINYQGVGIVACYYTRRDTTPPQLNVIFGLAKDLLTDSSKWLSGIINIQNYPSGYTRSGYQSFYHPINQFKGIGCCFECSSSYSYPKIVFTPESDMVNILNTLMP
ncbi:MAG: hypothetical protein WCX31_08175 [Salinivirgaceae bacterium]|jgi:hypothetical protein